MIMLIFIWRKLFDKCACKYDPRSYKMGIFGPLYPNESRAKWIKRISCRYHWRQTKYYYNEIFADTKSLKASK